MLLCRNDMDQKSTQMMPAQLSPEVWLQIFSAVSTAGSTMATSQSTGEHDAAAIGLQGVPRYARL